MGARTCRLFVIASLVFAFVPLSAEPFYYYAEELNGSGLFPVGWTKDGRFFAYGVWRESMQIARHVDLSIQVQDLVTDEIAWSFFKSWDESLMGGPEDTTPYPPGSVSEAWGIVGDEIDANLQRLGIQHAMLGMQELPYVIYDTDDTISVEIAMKGELEYDVRARSKKLGVKTIYSGKKGMDDDELRVIGYVPAPGGLRIAVVLESAPLGMPLTSLIVIGCNVKSGYKK